MVDEVFLGQPHTVVVQSAHREPGESPHHHGLQPRPPAGPLRRIAAAADARGARGARRGAAELRRVRGAPGYGGPWFSIVHGDLHGGNIAVDTRSYAWLIDYGEVEDAYSSRTPRSSSRGTVHLHDAADPARLLATAAPHELRWWLGVPEAVAAALAAAAAALAPAALTLEALLTP